MKEVIVTLTTLPDRLLSINPNGIKLCIDSLVNQSYPNYTIHFNVPLRNKFTNFVYNIPGWMKNPKYDKVKIYRIEEDLGPPTKLIPTVERITNPDAIIIVVDDDLVYHEDMVSEQVKNQEKWTEAVVGYDGLRSRNEDGSWGDYFGDARDYYYTSNYRDSLVDILQHYKSVSYKRRYFEDDFFPFVEENYSWSDDLVLAAYFSYKKRDRWVTYHSSDQEFKTREEWDLYGGVTTFPILRHTEYETGGCNFLRQREMDDNAGVLYKYIDAGYIKD